ncbi:MAG: PAS domain S-box protein [Desulfuromonadales bacterium]|nr:PAS domain S-box protein [Desulfuromonadales bacterium]
MKELPSGAEALQVEIRRLREKIRILEGEAGAFPDLAGNRPDISQDQEKKENLLERERDILQSVMDSVKNSHLAYLDLDFNFVRVNVTYAAACGYSPEEMIGKNHFTLYPHPENEAIFAGVRDTGMPVEYHDKPFEFPDQPERGVTYWDWTLAPVKDRDGVVTGLVLSLFETTERKRTEEALRQAKETADAANRAKSEFLANMSHEIRTPMTVFMAAVEHLLQIDRNPDRRHLLDLADQSARRLRALIDDILDFSRIEARRVELDEEPFELQSCLRSAVDLFSLAAREKNLRLELEVAPETPALLVGDPDRLGQVLINLIGNAVKFTSAGEVRVCVRPRGDTVEFAVADTGIGIPEEKRHRLFQSFSQVDSSFSRRFGGTGLGLAISKGLIDLMGGEISVRSREGKGSVFTFTLPRREAGKHPRALGGEPTL